jgi:rod shape-determining protein MreC
MLYRPEPLSMDYIGLDRAVRSYDEVTTSGLSDVFPPGLLVGFVSDVRVHRSDLYKIAEVVPAADLGNLRYVFVVRRKNGEHSDQS